MPLSSAQQAGLCGEMLAHDAAPDDASCIR